MIGWEGHDAGDLSPDADTSARAAFGTVTWIDVEEAATLLNVSVADLTPAKFDFAYAAAWDALHPSDETTTASSEAQGGRSSVTASLLIGAFTVMMMKMM